MGVATIGCDIHGAVEAYNDERYTRYLMPLSGIVGRNYRAFGCLFGVRNYSNFDPLFADRGFPDDLAWRTKEDIEGWGVDLKDIEERVDFHSPSYVTFEELQGVDWDAEADSPSEHYIVLDENKERTGHGFGWSSAFDEFCQVHAEELATGEPVEFDDTVDDTNPLMHDDGAYLQQAVFTRREAIDGAWAWLIDELLPVYADRFDRYDIRVVVWFDN